MSIRLVGRLPHYWNERPIGGMITCECSGGIVVGEVLYETCARRSTSQSETCIVSVYIGSVVYTRSLVYASSVAVHQ